MSASITRTVTAPRPDAGGRRVLEWARARGRAARAPAGSTRPRCPQGQGEQPTPGTTLAAAQPRDVAADCAVPSRTGTQPRTRTVPQSASPTPAGTPAAETSRGPAENRLPPSTEAAAADAARYRSPAPRHRPDRREAAWSA